MKRILALILALSMLVVICMLAGCGENTPAETTKPQESTKAPDDPSTTGSVTPPETTGSVTPPETTGGSDNTTPGTTTGGDDLDSWTGETKLPGFEDIDFRGTEFVIAASTNDAEFSKLPCADIYSEDTDNISTAVRKRNSTVEKLYNCKIKLVESDNPGSLVAADIAGNAHTVDLYNVPYTCSSTGTSNYNVLSLNIDFTNPWWDQEFVRALSAKNSDGTLVLGHLLGDFAIYSMSCTYMLAFNKNVYESAGIETKVGNIYDLVRTGKWTMDIFAEMVKKAATDTSGNSEFHASEGDVMGWIRTQYAAHAMHVASGLKMVDVVNGAMEFAMTNYSAEWDDVINKSIEIYSIPEGEDISYTQIPDYVASNSTLFVSEVIDCLARWKDKDMSLGLVPYPKFSETQENYYNYVDNHFTPYSVPVSVPDVDTLATFIELFAAHSRKIVRSAWIDAYCYEYCGDADSSEMLNIVLDGRTFDPAYLMFNKEGEISSMISTEKNNVTKWISRNGSSISDLIATNVSTRIK